MEPAEKYKHFVEGKRVYLRDVVPQDADGNYLNWMNDKQITQYLESRFNDYSREDLKNYIMKINQDPDFIFLAIVVKENNVHIGNIKMGPINKIHRIADVGIIIGDKVHWGKGYATEAIGLLSDYVFNNHNIHKLTAGCYANNPGSAKAFIKVGFVEEARLKQHCFCDGKFVDKICMGKINPNEEKG